MDEGTYDHLRSIWSQAKVPVIYRRGPGNPLLVRLPYLTHNRSWLAAFGRKRPLWDARKKTWEFPQSWFKEIVPSCLEKFGKLYIIQPYQENEKCAPACWAAEGEICQCSCMGLNHGINNPDGQWKIVSDAFAVRWNSRNLACRLISKNA